MYKYNSNQWIDSNENINIYKYLTDLPEREHTHDFVEIEYIWNGSGHQIINGTNYFVERGDLLFFNFGDVHEYYPDKEIGIINCLINPRFFGDELVNSENAMDILTLTLFKDFSGTIEDIPHKIKFLGRDLIELEAIMEFMGNEFKDKLPGYMTALKGYANVLLTKIFRVQKKQNSHSIYGDIDRITPQVLKYIEENYNKKLSLKELASSSFYNPSYFSRVFKECFGKTLTQYINEKRINETTRLIKETDFSMEEIGNMVGIRDKKQFYKTFKEYTGLTPNAYKKTIKKNPTNI